MNELHLFAGAGGGILGGILCGHTTICAVEINEYCRKTLLQRQREGILPRFPIWDDIKTFDGKPWKGKVDIVCGGFPCQDISIAGKGGGIDGERSGLWSEFARTIRDVEPRYVFVENSPMLTLRGGTRVISDLTKMGYNCKWGVIGADDAGANHRRKRIWIIAEMANSKIRENDKREIGFMAKTFQHGKSFFNATGISSSDLANSMCCRCQKTSFFESSDKKRRQIKNGSVEKFSCLSKSSEKSSWWSSEPGLGRMADGVAHWMDRLKAIGNGQVPAVVELAWKTISRM